MMKSPRVGFLLFTAHFIFPGLHAQSFDDLTKLSGSLAQVYYSPGHEERAGTVLARCEKAMLYVGQLVDFTPNISVFILAPEHWSKYATFPVYGMPHYPDKQRLVIAAEDNDFWRSFIPPLEQWPPDLARSVRHAYSLPNGNLSMMAFFDLLALHELGHAFHEQGGLKMQRLWMQELFCNIMLHTYIAENEPDILPALEVFPEMVVAAGTEGFPFRTLADFEARYDDMDPRNYGWYQCRLHVASKHIYNTGGKRTFVRLWKGLKSRQDEMTDKEFTDFLNKRVHKEVARVCTDW